MNGKDVKVLLGLGSNIEPRYTYLTKAMEMIENIIGKIEKSSSVFETEPVGMSADTNFFLNNVVEIRTRLTPIELLKKCLEIEQKLGRTRNAPTYESRNIDIDVLDMEGLVISEKELVLPHPKLHERLFVLVPLKEIRPDFIHPLLNKKVNELINDVSDTLVVKLWKSV